MAIRIESKSRRRLVITDEVKEEVAKIIAYAKDHPFVPPYAPPPGANPKLVLQLGDYRIVFAFTHHNGLIYRQIAIQIPGSRYAHQEAVMRICQLYEFTGWDGESFDKTPEGWFGGANELDRSVVMAQAIAAEKLNG